MMRRIILESVYVLTQGVSHYYAMRINRLLEIDYLINDQSGRDIHTNVLATLYKVLLLVFQSIDQLLEEEESDYTLNNVSRAGVTL